MAPFKVTPNQLKLATQFIAEEVVGKDLVTNGNITMSDEQKSELWDCEGKHTRLKWGDVVPVLVDGPFIDDQMVYRGCLHMLCKARNCKTALKDAPGRLIICNPSRIAPIMVKTPEPVGEWGDEVFSLNKGG